MSALGAKPCKVLLILTISRRHCIRPTWRANRASAAPLRPLSRWVCRTPGGRQKRLEELIDSGTVTAFPDALRLVRALYTLGWPMAVASSSRNANQMMKVIRLDSGQSLLDAFSINVCGHDLREGKPNPAIFLLAAEELGIKPAHCFVVEDAPAGIEAARAGGMTGLGVARRGDAALLWAAGADLVVTSLDEIAINELADGRLCLRPN